MAGLLDFLSSEDAALGLGLLAAAGPSAQPMSFGQRLAQGTDFARQRADAAEDRQIRKMMTGAQIAKMQRDAAFDQQFLGSGLMGAAPAPAGGPAAGGPAVSAAPTAGGAGVPGAGAPAAVGGGMSAAQISQRYGIPLDQVLADYRWNNGKKIAEFIADRSKPNWVNVGGNLVNTNAPGFAGGIQDQVSISNDGKAVVLRANGGNPVVGAPQGALDTFAAYQGISDRSRAANTPGRPEIRDDGRMGGQSQLDEINGGRAARVTLPGRPLGSNGPMPRGNFTGTSEQVLASIDASPVSPAVKEEMRRAYAAQVSGNNPPFDPMGTGALPPPASPAPLIGPGAGRGITNPAPAVQGGGVEFSPAEKAEQAAAQKLAEGRASAQVARETSAAATGRQFSQMSAAAELAEQLLDSGPTGSGVGALADRVGNFVGQPLKGASQAAQLKALGGWLVANVPRMEGPQSDRDVANYAVMAGQVGDETLPPSTRKAALRTVIELQTKYAAINGGQAPAGASANAPNTMASGRWVPPSGWSVRER